MTLPELLARLTEREQKEIQFALLYESQFAHGTDGHHRLVLLAKLVKLLLTTDDIKIEYMD